MAIHGRIGERLYFDTETDMRFIALSVYLDCTYNELIDSPSEIISITNSDFFASALVAFDKETSEYFCPLPVLPAQPENWIKIKNSNNVYVLRPLDRSFTFKNTDSSGTTIAAIGMNIELNPPLDTALYPTISITQDNKWIFTPGYLYGNRSFGGTEIIFPSASGFGSIDAINERLEYNTSSLALSEWLAVGEALKGANVDVDDDPFAPGGASGTGGGTGTFSGTGDAISIPSLPTLSATAAGFITLFNPSAAQMASLASYMWAGAFDLNTFRKIFADPMDCILGLSIVPVDVPAGSSAEVKVGNIGTGIYMTTAASQYVEVDCGSLNVEEFWGAYLDYEPFTKAEIYLPYVGTHPIAVDDIMGKSVHVVYHVDILSGACVAYVQCGSSVLYSFIGQCSSSIPITGNDWTNVVNGVLSIAGSIGSMVATGGASAPAAVTGIVSAAVNQMKPSVEKSGSLSGTGGMMGIQVPYLILTRPRQALPEKQNRYTGYPSFIHEDLGTLSGYTEVEEIHLENVPATDGEISEIVSLLKGGVIF